MQRLRIRDMRVELKSDTQPAICKPSFVTCVIFFKFFYITIVYVLDGEPFPITFPRLSLIQI